MKNGNGVMLGVRSGADRWELELLEARLLLSAAPTILSIDRESPAGAVTEAASVTYSVAFSDPVTGVTSADFQLVLTGGATASQTFVVSPGSGYSSAYDVTVHNIAGKGTLGLNLVDNGSILDQAGNHLANANGTFQPQQTFATGAAPSSVAVADVNGDGRPDLIAANAGGTVSVLLGNGDGTFQPQQTSAAGSYPASVAAADVNGDGKADLVVANNGDDTVSVLLGNSDGTFQSQQTLVVGLEPSSVAVADANGDGKADLVVANGYDDTVGVLLGNGNGTFDAQKTFDTGSDPTSVAAADVNGDGKGDLVVANGGDSTLSVLLGNGDGTFQAQKAFATAAVPSYVCVADMNGDGKADLVVANAGSDNVGVLLGNGDGTFQSQNTFAAGSEPGSVAVADLNGDGKPDLVAANMYSNNVSVRLANNSFMGQVYWVDPSAQLAFTLPPTSTTAGKVVNPATGVQVAVEDSGGATVNVDASAVTLTLSGGTFAGGGTTATVAAVNGVATFNDLIINAAGHYTLTAGDGSLTGATSGSFAVCPLGDVNLDGVANATDIDQVYAHFGDAAGRYDLNGDGAVNQADVDCLVKTILKTAYGDSNIDHAVDFTDFQTLLNHWQHTGLGWAGCDFNGDGVTDFLDFQALLNNWNPGGIGLGQQSDPTGTPSAAASIAAAVQIASPAVAPVSGATPGAMPGAMLPSAEACLVRPDPPDMFPQTEAWRPAQAWHPTEAWHSPRPPTTRPLRHATVTVQTDDANTVDLLIQLRSKSVVT